MADSPEVGIGVRIASYCNWYPGKAEVQPDNWTRGKAGILERAYPPTDLRCLWTARENLLPG